MTATRCWNRYDLYSMADELATTGMKMLGFALTFRSFETESHADRCQEDAGNDATQ